MGRYARLIGFLRQADQEAKCLGIRDLFKSTAITEVLLAEGLGHSWEPNTDDGPDASDSRGRGYEYKVSRWDAKKKRGDITFRINGIQDSKDDESLGDEHLRDAIRQKYGSLAGAYIGLRKVDESGQPIFELEDSFEIGLNTLIEVLHRQGMIHFGTKGHKKSLALGIQYDTLKSRCRDIERANKPRQRAARKRVG